MANRFLSNIRINDAYTFPASDGSNGQFIKTDGSGNLSFADPSASSSASVIYRDNFTGDGSTVVFDLQNSLTTEDQSFIYIDGVYQEKDTYSLSSTQITFTTAPISGHSIEVISIAGINTGPTVIYQDNFTGNGSSTDFTLAQVIDNEVKTFVFLNGVYQFKGTYAVDSTTLSFDTAPANGVDIEVISIASAAQTDSLQAGAVIIPVKNTHTASIAKGEPVYITGNIGNSARLQIAPADASDSAKMPSAGLLLTALAVNEEGYVITGGYLRNLATDTIDGTSTSSNDTVYVKAGGGLTMTKPTGSNLIQNVAKVARSSGGNSGSLLVSSILRTNDIPNLTTGKIWVGDGNTTESTVVHLDESNNRLGINNNSPNYSLDVTGDANISSNVIIGGNLTVDGTQTVLNTQTVEVEDNILQLNTTQGSPDTATATTSGISVYRGDGVTQASFIFDDADDTWDLTNNLVVDGNAEIVGTLTSAKVEIENTGADLLDLTRTSVGTYRLAISLSDAFSIFDVGANTDRLIIDSSGNSTFAGNVIINGDGKALKWTPTSYDNWSMTTDSNGLVIYNITDARYDLKISGDGNSTFGGEVFLKSRLNLQRSSGGATTLIQFKNENGVDRAHIDFGGTNEELSFFAGAGTVENMRIDGSGNVGIGTDLPGTKLQVNTAGAGDGALRLGVLNQEQYVFETGISGITNGALILKDVTTPYTYMTFRGGNVGIGTTSPSRNLDIEGTGDVYISLVTDVTGTSGILLGDVNADYLGRIEYANNTNKLYLYSNNTLSQTIDASGNVGIGTTSPTNQMHIHTNNDNTYALRIEGSTNNAAGVWTGIGIAGESANTKSAIIFQDIGVSYSRGKLLFCVNNDENQNSASPSDARMAISNDGNVGIGTTSPDTLLNVEGSSPIITIEDDRTSIGDGTIMGRIDFKQNDDSGSGTGVSGSIYSISQSTTGQGSSLAFNTGVPGSTTEKMRILSSGGITFNGDTSTANALDDYEEGTWTPTISHNNGTGAIPLTVSGNATYVKVGKVVHVRAYLTNINPNGNAGGSGAYYAIRSLPFTASADGAWEIVYASPQVNSYGGYWSGNNLYFMHNGTNGQRSAVHVNGTHFNAFGANASFMFQAVYTTP